MVWHLTNPGNWAIIYDPQSVFFRTEKNAFYANWIGFTNEKSAWTGKKSVFCSPGCEYQTLQSYCPWHALQARTMTQCLWPRFHAPVTLSWFYVESSIKVHSNCPQHSLQTCTMTRCPWPRFRAPVTLSWFHVESSIKVRFSVAVIAVGVKPCIVIILDIFFKHDLWPGALDLNLTLKWLCYDFRSSLALKCASLQQW